MAKLTKRRRKVIRQQRILEEIGDAFGCDGRAFCVALKWSLPRITRTKRGAWYLKRDWVKLKAQIIERLSR